MNKKIKKEIKKIIIELIRYSDELYEKGEISLFVRDRVDDFVNSIENDYMQTNWEEVSLHTYELAKELSSYGLLTDDEINKLIISINENL